MASGTGQRQVSTSHGAGFFTAVNARYLSPPQVARTFVPYEPFDRLLGPENTVLVGPRGSGKTTLFKMLQSDALEVWRHRLANQYCERISFSSVLIPADPTWHAQLAGLADSPRLTTDDARALADAAFTSHVLQALIRVMRERARSVSDGADIARVFQRVSLSQVDARTIVEELTKAWMISPSDATLAGVDWALGARLAKIGQAVEGGLADHDRAFLHLDFLSCATFAIDMFNELVAERDRRWALLFDELETAPAALRHRLIRLFRMGNPRLFLKLSMFPLSTELEPADPQTDPLPGQDYEFISLSVPRKRASVRFASELAESVLRERGIDQTAREFLGKATFLPAADVPEQEPSQQSAPRSAQRRLMRDRGLAKIFRELAESDATFSGYLARNGLDKGLEAGEWSQLDKKTIDKIQNLVLVRHRFGGPKRRQSRRSLAAYTGHPVVLTLMELQPRLLLIFLRTLLQDPAVTNRASAFQQGIALEKVIQHVLDLLSTVPVDVVKAPTGRNTTDGSVVEFVDRIGAALAAVALDGPFDADAVGSFFLDRDSTSSEIRTVERAINVGAVVRVPLTNDEYSPLYTIVRERLRLSFLLSPRYHLPIRIGRAVRLDRLLSDGPSQLPLFGTEEILE